MARSLRVVLALIVAAVAAVPLARADIVLHLDQRSVRVGGVVSGWGDGSGMPVFLVSVGVSPRPFACGENAICAPQSRARPGPPLYTLLGSLRATGDLYAKQRLRFRVPRVKRGTYKVVIWCRVCGGSLILAGSTIEGQTVIVR